MNHLTSSVQMEKTNEDCEGFVMFYLKGMKAEEKFDEIGMKIEEQYCNVTQAVHTSS